MTTEFTTTPVPTAPATLAEALERLDVEAARRIQAEETLRVTEERFRSLSARVGKFLWISDAQTNELIYTSPGYEEVWARTREDSYRTPEQWADSFTQGGPRVTILPAAGEREKTYPVAAPDGSVRWIRDRLFPIRDVAGGVQRILGIAEDVTEAKMFHEDLTKNAARMKALLAVVPDLLFRVRKDGTILEFHAGQDSQIAPAVSVVAAAGATVVRQTALPVGTDHLAVSLEPPGGSPTGAPTGPVLFVGRLGT